MTKKKPTPETKPSRKRIPRYVDNEGNYLVVSETRYEFQLAWFIAEWDDIGGVLGEDEADKDYDVAVRTALDAYCKRIGIERQRGKAYTFETRKQANEALRLCNAALHFMQSKKPLPEWATTALAAGWAPPKGWKP